MASTEEHAQAAAARRAAFGDDRTTPPAQVGDYVERGAVQDFLYVAAAGVTAKIAGDALTAGGKQIYDKVTGKDSPPPGKHAKPDDD